MRAISWWLFLLWHRNGGNFLDEEYFAGLRNGDLCRQLLWRMDFTGSDQREGCIPYRAPTWSWASIEGLISGISNPVVCYTLLPNACEAEVEVISAEMTPVEGGHRTGQVVDRNIVLRGKVKAGRLRKDRSGLYRLDDMGFTDGNIRPSLLPPDFDLGDRTHLHCLLLGNVESFPVAGGFAFTVFGLLLERLQGPLKTYQRLGTFKLTGDHCSWFDNCTSEEVILI